MVIGRHRGGRAGARRNRRIGRAAWSRAGYVPGRAGHIVGAGRPALWRVLTLLRMPVARTRLVHVSGPHTFSPHTPSRWGARTVSARDARPSRSVTPGCTNHLTRRNVITARIVSPPTKYPAIGK
jgi:hypothetical protein